MFHSSEELGEFFIAQLISGQKLLKPAWFNFCSVASGWPSGGQCSMSRTIVAVDCGKVETTYSNFVKDGVISCFLKIDSTVKNHSS